MSFFLHNGSMKDTKLFFFLVGIGFAFAMLMSFIPWHLYASCFQDGMMPDIVNQQRCVEISTPKAFGITEQNEPKNDILSPIKQFKLGVPATDIQCRSSLSLIIKHDNTPACVFPESVSELIVRGWAKENPTKLRTHVDSQSSQDKTKQSSLDVKVTGEQEVRRGITHNIYVDVSRNDKPVSDAYVRITIEDYGENVIRDFEGRTNENGKFVFSWEIPKSFDDIETLLAYIGVSDNTSSKTVLFKFQVYCLPGESGCKVEGN